jgi:hypothetical protein
LEKYLLYSSALSQRACWRTSLVILLGGAGESSLLIDDNVNTFGFLPKEKKTRAQCHINARRDTEDGPLEITHPTESSWF